MTDCNQLAKSFEDLTPEELEALEQASRRIAIELAKGNTAHAHHIVDETERLLFSVRGFDASLMDTSLAEAGVDIRILNLLESGFNATTIGDALELNLDRLIASQSMGPTLVIRLFASILGYTVPRCIKLEEELRKARK